MRGWRKSLDSAGVREPGLREDYDRQRQTVRRFRRTAYLAARLLLPRRLLPHVVAATAVMHHGDNLLDTGPLPQRETAWASWERQVREVLRTGSSDDPLLRALVHTASAHPQLREIMETYLATATAELHFAGFATEADYQAYVDAYSYPAFMLVAGLLAPEGDDLRYQAACRTFIDGSQRLDFVNDLAEDVREGRVGIPVDAMERFGVTMGDLTAGIGGSALEELIAEQVTIARGALLAARELPALTPADGRRLAGALVEMELLTAEAVLARGAGVLRGSANPPLGRTLRVLARRY
ncbi:squalene/phytoene synthase family protein [Streptomyces cynarae]|uniref:Squalene/phytoene synthase family protein n=1 Tax=Streptomyces cynarae TaxID=2981134 RepID=A0ABY6E8W5_9ACTN|nr:squalene/phytoene synthase family protein [Streptomyces cynarae]UXY23009.1 squalene/phytoene synthase family protein [Streptomyces cynarae]